ncbi:hypothetical protein CLAIMM_14269 [Cladophialophora immunda]|nr:hypothetical protein CLAIMM_14269 [Cladophialophora immunda]
MRSVGGKLECQFVSVQGTEDVWMNGYLHICPPVSDISSEAPKSPSHSQLVLRTSDVPFGVDEHRSVANIHKKGPVDYYCAPTTIINDELPSHTGHVTRASLYETLLTSLALQIKFRDIERSPSTKTSELPHRLSYRFRCRDATPAFRVPSLFTQPTPSSADSFQGSKGFHPRCKQKKKRAEAAAAAYFCPDPSYPFTDAKTVTNSPSAP